MKAEELDGPRLGTFVGVNVRCSRCGMVHGMLVFEEEEVDALDAASVCCRTDMGAP